MKACNKCGLEQAEDQFQIRSDTGKRRGDCRTCRSANNLTRYHTKSSTKEAHRLAGDRHRWKKLYGISVEDYHHMLEQQGGKCAICAQPDEGRALAVDHCHTTGRVRGLLCLACNTAIGKLRDDPELIRRAAEYIETNR